MAPPTSQQPTVQDHQDSEDDLDETLQKLFDSSSPNVNEDEDYSQKMLDSSDTLYLPPSDGLAGSRPRNVLHIAFSGGNKAVNLSEELRPGRTIQPAAPGNSDLSNSRVRDERLVPQKRKSPTDPLSKTRNSFRVVGTATQKQTGTGYAISDINVSNMILRGSPLDEAHLSALFELSERVDISQISSRFDDIRAGRVSEWVVFGCLVKKHAKRETKNGAKFAVWSLYNMPRWSIADSRNPPEATMITVLVFDQAFANLHNLVEGSALALRRATLMPPRESETGARSERGGAEWCGYCIKVTKPDQVVILGMCQDYRLCGEPNGDSGECQVWFDANRLKMCSRHTQQKRMRMLRGTRMDVNNAERPMGRAENGTSAFGNVNDVSRASFGGVSSHHPDTTMEGHKRRNAADREKAVALIKRQEDARGVARHVRAPSLSRILHQAATKQDGIPVARRTDEGLKCALKRGKIMVQQTESQLYKGTVKNLKQLNYNSAVDNLIHLGFKVNDRGDLIAPERVPGVTLRRSAPFRGIEKESKRPKGVTQMTNGINTVADSQGGFTRTTEDVYLSDESG